MSVSEMYGAFRRQFPDFAAAVDQRHIDFWGEIEEETRYSWFESVAATVNAKMGDTNAKATILAIFDFFETGYRRGDSEQKNCIDVSFVENLFWEVKPETAAPYWQAFPDSLRRLYLEFHGSAPVSL